MRFDCLVPEIFGKWCKMVRCEHFTFIPRGQRCALKIFRVEMKKGFSGVYVNAYEVYLNL